MRRDAIVVACIVIAVAAAAYVLQPRPWTKEPTTFLGFALGKPLDPGIKPCDLRKVKLPCNEIGLGAAETNLTILIAAEEGMERQVSVSIEDGKVVSVKALDSNPNQMLADLREKYGPPNGRSAASAKWEAQNWTGKDVDLSYMVMQLDGQRIADATASWNHTKPLPPHINQF